MMYGKKVSALFVLFLFLFSLGGPGPAMAAEDPLVFGVAASLPVAGTDGGQKIIVRALLRPRRSQSRTRAPLAVALVLDKSGSMRADGKMENARRGAEEALRMLGIRDVAALVAYDDLARVSVSARRIDGEDGVFLRAVSRLHPGGSTALYDGLLAGARELLPFVEEGYIPRIILLSDGMANVGPSSAEALARLGRKLARQEMTITTIGLGLDYNEDLMTAVAEESGGNSYFARNGGMLPEIFARDMADALSVTARKMRLTLTCGEGVRPLGIIGRAGEVRGNSMEVSLDNLYGEGEKYGLFEIELPEGEEGQILQAVSVGLEYEDAATGERVSRELPLKILRTENEAEVEKNRQMDIVSQAALARNAEIRTEAIRLADEGRAREAAELLESRKDDLRTLAPAAGAAAPLLESEAGEFETLAESLKSEGALSNADRKKVLNDAFIQKSQQTPVTSSGDMPEKEEPGN